MSDIDKISRTVIQPSKELLLRMHVRLLRENDGRKENFHKLFEIGGNKYLSLDIQAYLTLELKRDEWSIDKWVMINQTNIVHIIKGFKKMLNAIYNEGIFANTKGNKIILYKDKVKEHTQKIFNLGNNNRLMISPAIVYDDNDTSYEGVIIYLNKTDNYTQLPIDAFESLIYSLEKIDIFIYSQEILNYYMSCLKDQKIELQPNVTTFRQHPILTKPKEVVTSTIIKTNTDKDFFGLEDE